MVFQTELHIEAIFGAEEILEKYETADEMARLGIFLDSTPNVGQAYRSHRYSISKFFKEEHTKQWQALNLSRTKRNIQETINHNNRVY